MASSHAGGFLCMPANLESPSIEYPDDLDFPDPEKGPADVDESDSETEPEVDPFETEMEKLKEQLPEAEFGEPTEHSVQIKIDAQGKEWVNFGDGWKENA